MPNFIVEHNENLQEQIDINRVLDCVFEGAKNSGHFPPEAIKLRSEPRKNYRLHGKQKNFLHIRGHILSGRTDAQKVEISKAVMAPLEQLELNSVFVSVEIVDIHRESFLDFTYE